jgi:hypothetical protein
MKATSSGSRGGGTAKLFALARGEATSDIVALQRTD